MATVTPPVQLPAVLLGDVAFRAELATTSQQHAEGLSGRESLAPKSGMLFIFESGVASVFWMKEMRFPLDFIWISKGCIVVDITAEAPAPGPATSTSQLPYYASESLAAYTFEINAGEAAKYSITVGTAVRFLGVAAEPVALCE